MKVLLSVIEQVEEARGNFIATINHKFRPLLGPLLRVITKFIRGRSMGTSACSQFCNYTVFSKLLF